MACGCQKISGMKKGKKAKVSGGYTDDIMEMVLDGGLAIGAGYLTSKAKGYIPVATDPTSFYGKYQSHIVNGVLIVAGLAAAVMPKDAETKKYLRPIGLGVAVQAGISLAKTVESGVPSMNAWNTYALGRTGKIGLPHTYALGTPRNFNVPAMGRAFDVNGDPIPKTPKVPVRQPLVKVSAKRAVGGL